MADATLQLFFSKKLSKRDLDHGLVWPERHLAELPDFNGGHKVDFAVKDREGTIWNFKCSKRMTGDYERLVVSAGWIPFHKSKGNIKAGDEVIINRIDDPTARFRIGLKRRIVIYGRNINDEEI